MPKINAIRVVNYRYNDGKRLWLDETFDLRGGINALITLQNGGGKTVLIQGIMQVVNPNTSLRKRQWKGFFTEEGTPTYLLLEWLLDDGVSYATTGVAFELRQGKVDYYMFTTTYKTNAAYDIRHLKLTEEIDQTLKFTPFKEFKKQLMDYRNHCLSTGLPGAVRVFDIKRDYHQGLRELNINHEEWLTTMRKINEAEGGMNEVFENTVTTERVIKDLILPQVEQKLIQQSESYDVTNPTSSLFQETQIQLNDLVEEKIKLEEKIEAKENLLSLNDLLEKQFLPQKARYQTQLNEKEQLLIELTQVEVALETEMKQLEEKQAQLEVDLATLNEQEELFAYEKKSYDYRLLTKEIEEKEMAFVQIKEQLNEAKQALDEAIELKNQTEAGYYHQKKIKCQDKRAAKEMVMSQLKAKDFDLERQLTQVGGEIRYLLEAEQTSIQEQASQKQTELNRLETEMDAVKHQLNETQTSMNQLSGSVQFNQAKLKENQTAIGQLMGDYPEWEAFDRSLSSADRLIETATHEYEGVHQQLEVTTKTIEQIEGQLGTKETEQRLASNHLNELNYELTQKENEQTAFLNRKDQMYQKLNQFYDQPLTDSDDVYRKDVHLTHFSQLNETYETDFLRLKQQELQWKDELSRLEKGVRLEFPEELLVTLNDHQIAYQKGVDFLAEHLEFKSSASHSLLAHALILTNRDLERLRSLNLTWKTDFIIPLINRDQLKDWLDTEVVDGFISTNGTLELACHFNADWLDENYLAQLKAQLNEQLSQVKLQLSSLNRQKKEISKLLTELELFTATKEEEQRLDEALATLRQEKAKLEASLMTLASQIEGLTQEKTSEVEKQTQLTMDLGRCEQVKKDTLQLKALFEQELSLTQEKEVLSGQLSDIQAKVETLTRQFEGFMTHRMSLKDDIQQFASDLKQCQTDLMLYEGYVAIESQQTKEYLTQWYLQLKAKRSENELELLEKEIQELNQEIHDCESTIQSISVASRLYETLEITSLTMVVEREKDVEAKRQAERKVADESIALGTTIQTLTKNAEKQAADILESFGKAAELLEQINPDFKTRRTTLTAEKEELDQRAKAIETYVSQLKGKEQEFVRILDLVDEEELALIKTHLTPTQSSTPIQLAFYNLKEMYQKTKTVLSEIASLGQRWDEQLKTQLSVYQGQALFEPLFTTLQSFDPQSKDYLLNCCQVFERQLVKNEALLNKLEKDLNSLDEMFEEFSRDCTALARNIYDELKLFGKGINIKWKGVSQQLIYLRGGQPIVDLEVAMKTYLSETLDVLISLHHDNRMTELADQIHQRMNIDTFLNLMTPIQSYKLSIFKIEIQREQSAYKPWEELVIKASGGERFFASFVLSAALLTYSRFDRTLKDLNKMGKVLVMDNPFGVVTSQHLLQPVFELANKLNIQMLCFTGIGDINIYDNFDLVYALRVEDITTQLSHIELTLAKEPEEYIQTFNYYKQGQLEF